MDNCNRSMADDDRAKRLKSSHSDVAEVAELRGRVAELESEITKLRSEIAWLRQLGRRQEEGSHEVLPVVTKVIVSTAIDLSRLDTGLVARISSFLVTPRELLNLTLTCKSFGWRQPTSTLNWSLMEEVSRQAVCSRATDAEMRHLPSYVSGTTTWLSILHRYEHLLLFDVLLGGYIEHRNGDKTTVYAKGEEYRSSVAVSSGYVMKAGAHYVEFLVTGKPFIGIVRPMSGLDAGAYQHEGISFIGTAFSGFYPDFLAQRSDDWGDSDIHACDFDCGEGAISSTDWAAEEWEWEQWEGMECLSGDTVGMLLNLDEGTLAVYKNNCRLGVMKDGLSGAYCWYVSLFRRNSGPDIVSIKRGTLPDSDRAIRA